MKTDSDAVDEVAKKVEEQAKRWPGVKVDSGQDLMQLLLGRGLLARLHPDGGVEIPFPRPVAEELVAAGRAQRHHALPDSGWVDFRIESTRDLEPLVELLDLAFRVRQEGSKDRTKELDAKIDEASKESFPASDSPAISDE